ncbi:MAG: spore germination protein [Gemmiger sp.]
MNGIHCAIALFTGLSSPEKFWVLALEALDRQSLRATTGPELLNALLRTSAIPAESQPVLEWEDLTEKISNGLALLLADGCGFAVAFSTQEMPQRSVGMPQGEGDIRGSQEGFTELLRTNIAMLRRQFRSGDLVAEINVSNTPAKTEYCVCYSKAAAPAELVEQVRQHLSSVQLPLLLDSAYFASFLKENKLNLFPAAGYTERTATACARLSEGKLVILVAGSPNAMILPCFFSENFETLDDYTSSAVFAGLVRIVKYLAFFLSVFGPGFYLVAVNYAPEIIPRQLLTMLATAEATTPLPLMLEMLLVVVLLEIVREAGLRAPKPFGNTVSIVGGLIIGETAVSAGIISTPVLIACAASMIATLAVPQLYEQSILFRMLTIFLTGWFGMPGFTCAVTLLVSMAIGSSNEMYDYLYPLLPACGATWRDGLTRSIWSQLAKKEYTIGKIEKRQ